MRHLRHGSWFAMVLALVCTPLVTRAQQPAGYAGDKACVDCHKKEIAQFGGTAMSKLIGTRGRTAHERLGCESCHGPAGQHVESGAEERGGLISFSKKTKTSVKDRNAVCLGCHEKSARLWWKGSVHESRNVACTDCHTVMHDEAERGSLATSTVLETCGKCHAQKKAQVMRSSHMPLGENRMECSNCHNPHGSPNEKMLAAGSVNETCYSCHAEKRGPYLYEHTPVLESCSNCHDPHGSNQEKLLKLPRPRLCQSCHPTAHGGSLARPSDPTAVRFAFNKSCGNCHFNIHGSNHPAGAFFTR